MKASAGLARNINLPLNMHADGAGKFPRAAIDSWTTASTIVYWLTPGSYLHKHLSVDDGARLDESQSNGLQGVFTQGEMPFLSLCVDVCVRVYVRPVRRASASQFIRHTHVRANRIASSATCYANAESATKRFRYIIAIWNQSLVANKNSGREDKQTHR